MGAPENIPEASAAYLLILSEAIVVGAMTPSEALQRTFELGRLRGQTEGIEIARAIIQNQRKPT